MLIASSAKFFDTLPAICCEELEDLFARLFASTQNTRLCGIEGDPLYLPWVGERQAEVCYVKGSLPSALHEIAHWCVAGKERRRYEDYGYWYKPDGRTLDEQACFERVEVKPQAIEWLLSSACQRKFVISCDNLSGAAFDVESFRRNVYMQALAYIEHGIPARTRTLIDGLLDQCATRALFEEYWLCVRAEKLIPTPY